MKRKLNVIIANLIILFMLGEFTISVNAATQADKAEVQEQINETEKELQQVEANLSQAMKELQALEGDISEAEYNLQKLQSELDTLLKEISNLEEQLEVKIEQYNGKYEQACTRVVAQHKYGNITFLDVLLNSESLTDFLSNYYVVQKIMEADQQFLEELANEKQQIETDKATVEEKKAQVETEKSEVEKQNVILTNKKNEKQKRVAKLSAQDAALQKEKEQYYAELSRIEEEIRKQAQQSGTGGGSYSGGSLEFPCPGYRRVSSWFGNRGAPLAGGSSYHKGIDFAASKGTPIYASESGSVILVRNGCTHNYGKSKSCGCGSGYGNYLMINHGGGLVTVYAHCTSINVSVGSHVTRGQLIATVGSTGASTGHHLHYGVLKNGTYVDPAPYIGL